MAELNIIRVALFECYETQKESEKIKVADLVGKRIFNLEKDKKKYENLKSILEFNIKKKLESKETTDLSKKKCIQSAVSEMFGLDKRGRTPISLILNLKKEGENLFDKLLNINEDNLFKKVSAEFANKYVSYKRNVKGIIGFIQFDLKLNLKEERFLAVITTDFIKGALLSDPSEAIKFLEKAFDQNFRNIIIYPYLESISHRTINISKSSVKVHQRMSDPDLFIISNIESPLDPQKIFDDLYKSMRGETNDLNDILEQLEEDYPNKVYVTIKFRNYSFKVSFKDFLENFKLINEDEKGQGIFIKNTLVHIEIAGKNLLNDQKIRYQSLTDLSEELNNEKS